MKKSTAVGGTCGPTASNTKPADTEIARSEIRGGPQIANRSAHSADTERTRFKCSACWIALATLISFIARSASAEPVFTEVAEQVGINFVHQQSGTVAYLRGMSAGAAVGDYDGDRRLDLFVANDADAGVDPPPASLHHALFRNLGNGQFENVIDPAQILPYPYSNPLGTGWAVVGGPAAGCDPRPMSTVEVD